MSLETTVKFTKNEWREVKIFDYLFSVVITEQVYWGGAIKCYLILACCVRHAAKDAFCSSALLTFLIKRNFPFNTQNDVFGHTYRDENQAECKRWKFRGKVYFKILFRLGSVG